MGKRRHNIEYSAYICFQHPPHIHTHICWMFIFLSQLLEVIRFFASQGSNVTLTSDLRLRTSYFRQNSTLVQKSTDELSHQAAAWHWGLSADASTCIATWDKSHFDDCPLESLEWVFIHFPSIPLIFLVFSILNLKISTCSHYHSHMMCKSLGWVLLKQQIQVLL